MSLIRKAIKIGDAAKLLSVSTTAIRDGKAGTKGLTVFRRPGSNRLWVWESEVKRLLEKDVEIVRRGEYASD